ncbi:MAG TPA: transglycosylase SLT domain-containing protein, partial [Dissulfurispiraceae bacterium]|nr:transglycosylase SLT domain-containing protein [Dissulfurispiraceae bacterium]
NLGIHFPSDNTTALSSIERSLNLFTVRIREKFTRWLERSARYIDIMKGILKERKLPEELVFLPIVESGFNCNAYSRARAVGPWQFIEATAKRYGLVVDWWRDERRDPVKSTEAAAAYLRDLYKMFGSWNLALAGYNAGEGTILRALKKTDADDYWSLLHTKQIRDETKEYVSHFLAATMIAHAPEEYGFSNLAYHQPLEYDEVVITTALDLQVIAECSDASLEEIRELNPELRRWSTPPNVDSYVVRLPKGTKDIFTENLLMLPEEERFSFDNYTVKKGEDFKKIASKLNLPVSVILALNDMSGIEQLKRGSEIRIPPQGKFLPDLDDRMSAKKVSLTKKAPGKQKSSVKSRSRTLKDTSRKSKDKIKARRI